MKKEQTVLHEMVGTFSHVRNIFNGSIKAELEPDFSVKPEESVIGLLEEPISRAFWSELKKLYLKAESINSAHEAFHKSGQFHSVEDCLSHQRQMVKFRTQGRLFDLLFAEGVRSCFPAVNKITGYIRVGWRVAAVTNITDFLLANMGQFGKEHISRQFFVKLRQALLAESEEGLSFAGLKFRNIDMKAEEFGVGQVTSPALKALYLLQDELAKAMDKELGDGYADIAELEFAGKDFSRLLTGLMAKAERLSTQHELAMILFWLGVREIIPGANDYKKLAIRKGWTIVNSPPSDEEEEDGPSISFEFLGL